MRYVLLCFFIIFQACGDSFQYAKSSSNILEDAFFLSDDLSLTESPDSLYILLGESKTLAAVAYLNGNALGSSSLSEYYFFRFWEYEESVIASEKINITPTKSISRACHYSIDFFGDSLSKCFDIFLDNPIEISLLKPLEKANDININDSITFSIDLKGIDSFESAVCNLYISNTKSSLWSNLKKGSFDCSTPQKIKLDRTASDIFYWGVTVNVNGKNGIDTVFSNISNFALKPYKEHAIVILPIVYENARPDKKNGQVTLFKGDSVDICFKIFGDTLLVIDSLEENKDYKVKIQEFLKTDYASDSMFFTVKEHVYNILDTLFFKDNIAPEAFPLKNTFALEDSIRFFAAENGSGINALHSAIIISSTNDTLPYRFNSSRFAFFVECDNICDLQIRMQDNAKNDSPKKTWKLVTDSDSVHITGPFMN